MRMRYNTFLCDPWRIQGCIKSVMCNERTHAPPLLRRPSWLQRAATPCPDLFAAPEIRVLFGNVVYREGVPIAGRQASWGSLYGLGEGHAYRRLALRSHESRRDEGVGGQPTRLGVWGKRFEKICRATENLFSAHLLFIETRPRLFYSFFSTAR